MCPDGGQASHALTIVNQAASAGSICFNDCFAIIVRNHCHLSKILRVFLTCWSKSNVSEILCLWLLRFSVSSYICMQDEDSGNTAANVARRRSCSGLRCFRVHSPLSEVPKLRNRPEQNVAKCKCREMQTEYYDSQFPLKVYSPKNTWGLHQQGLDQTPMQKVAVSNQA